MENKGRLTKRQSVFLDYVRGISAQLVLVGHAMSMLYPKAWLGGRFDVQSLAVVVFFILSGFLIARTTIVKRDAGKYTLGSYMIDRIARIYTPFVPALFFILAVDWYVRSQGVYDFDKNYNVQTFVGNLFQLQDYPIFRLGKRLGEFTISSFGTGRPLWTVAIEWWYYIFFGLLAFTTFQTVKRSPKLIVLGALSALVAIAGFVAPRGPSLVWAWALAACYGIWSIRNESQLLEKHGLKIGLVAGLISAIRYVGTNEPYDLSACGMMLISFFAFLEYLRSPAVKETVAPWAKWLSESLSKISYSLYLTHYTVAYAITHCTPGLSLPMKLVVTFVLANIVAIVFYLLFEQRYKAVGVWLRKVFGLSGSKASVVTGPGGLESR